MRIRIGYELVFDSPQPTPMILMLNVHYSRVGDLQAPDHIVVSPSVPITGDRDAFGNWCTSRVAPVGPLRLATDTVVNDPGTADPVDVSAQQLPVQDLPEDTLVYLLASRYCETDRIVHAGWALFGTVPTGWRRVQAICDHVHRHLTFGYEHARPTKSALDAAHERLGVCRDFAHLAITYCRCMNIQACYCTVYLGEIGVAPDPAPMDFSSWFEAYLGGRWHTFDARHSRPRIGRILIARGRDAADVALATTFGPNTLMSFKVWTDEVAH